VSGLGLVLGLALWLALGLSSGLALGLQLGLRLGLGLGFIFYVYFVSAKPVAASTLAAKETLPTI